MLEVTHLHSLTNNDYEQNVTDRPLRNPHHSASHVAIVGGGNTVRPGEISLSHRGFYFLMSYRNFNVIASVHRIKINQYRRKVLGPLLDRIDLYVTVQEVEHEKLLTQKRNPGVDQTAKHRILSACDIQRRRYHSKIKLNCDMTNCDISHLSNLDTNSKSLLNIATQRLDISAHGYMRAIKVARAIADLDGPESIVLSKAHISEAFSIIPTSLSKKYGICALTPVAASATISGIN